MKEPVGLEYTTGAVSCAFSYQRGVVMRRSGIVDESAEDLFPADLVLGEVDRLWWPGLSLSRCELAEGAVRPGRVVVPQVLN